MEATTIFIDLGKRLETLTKTKDPDEANALDSWIASGGLESLKPQLRAYLKEIKEAKSTTTYKAKVRPVTRADSVTFEVPSYTTIGDLKATVGPHFNIPVDQMRMFFGSEFTKQLMFGSGHNGAVTPAEARAVQPKEVKDSATFAELFPDAKALEGKEFTIRPTSNNTWTVSRMWTAVPVTVRVSSNSKALKSYAGEKYTPSQPRVAIPVIPKGDQATKVDEAVGFFMEAEKVFGGGRNSRIGFVNGRVFHDKEVLWEAWAEVDFIELELTVY